MISQNDQLAQDDLWRIVEAQARHRGEDLLIVSNFRAIPSAGNTSTKLKNASFSFALARLKSRFERLLSAFQARVEKHGEEIAELSEKLAELSEKLEKLVASVDQSDQKRLAQSAFIRFAEIESLSDDWDHDGAPKPNKEVISWARIGVGVILGFPTRFVVNPLGDGGIEIEFVAASGRAIVDIYNSGSVVLLFHGPDGKRHVLETTPDELPLRLRQIILF